MNILIKDNKYLYVNLFNINILLIFNLILIINLNSVLLYIFICYLINIIIF